MYDLIIVTITSLSIVLVLYHHIGYPLILRSVQRRSNKEPLHVSSRQYTTTDDDAVLPTISIIIPAYNEERWIADKIHNLSIIDYPDEKLKIIVACDGCTDKTVEISQQAAQQIQCEHMDIEIRDFSKNRGKVAIINEVVKGEKSDIIALSDVSALISIDALLIAAKHFNDPKLGVLNGHYRLLNPGSTGEDVYWKYQSDIKSSESAIGSTLGAHGAFYLFRRELFTPLTSDTINDDFILPMQIVAAGYKAKYDSDIVALEQEKADDEMDHKRRRRIAAGNMQQLLRLKSLLSPSHRGTAFTFISGKGLRVLMPFLMIISLVGSIVLAIDYSIFILLACIQLFMYSLAGWQLVFKPKHSSKVVQALAYLVGGHVAGLIGSIRYLSGFEKGPWKRVNTS